MGLTLNLPCPIYLNTPPPPTLFIFISKSFLILSSSSYPLHLLSFSNPSMMKTRGGHSFRPKVMPSSPSPIGRSKPGPAAAAAAPPPTTAVLCLQQPPPLSLPRAVLPWVLQRLLLLPMPLLLFLLLHAGTILGLALFLPLPHILGHLGGPHYRKGPKPLA